MSRKNAPLPLTPQGLADYRKALIENAAWAGERGEVRTYHDPELQRAYEAALVLS